MNDSKMQMLSEIQMITGQMTADFDYAMALLLGNGAYAKLLEEPVVVESEYKIQFPEIADVSTWFHSL